ncbi:HigA family addiction module antitoxin [Hyphobacterium sp.]|uniref:HigA family addiction module antitoxin n=1 Tax=Hyphobacterium sp. TaxID=2004662 RepID=UPI003BA92181
MTIKLHDTLAVHPGPWLRRNIVEPFGLNVSQTAEHLQVSRVALSNLLNGKAALSPDMALRFEKAFGVSAATLLRMQASHDLAAAKKTAKTGSIARIEKAA